MPLERMLTRRELAGILNLSHRTLERLAVVGGGPRYVLVSGVCRYRPSDIEAYLDARTLDNSAQRDGLEDGTEPTGRRRGRPRKAAIMPNANLAQTTKAQPTGLLEGAEPLPSSTNGTQIMNLLDAEEVDHA